VECRNPWEEAFNKKEAVVVVDEDDDVVVEEMLEEDMLLFDGTTAGHTDNEMTALSPVHPMYRVSQHDAKSKNATAAKRSFHTMSVQDVNVFHSSICFLIRAFCWASTKQQSSSSTTTSGCCCRGAAMVCSGRGVNVCGTAMENPSSHHGPW
jgi:hypothetical protein